MEFRTIVDIPTPDFTITNSSVMVMLGSCFVENIGNMFTNNKFHCVVNPFGVRYNPHSIFNALDLLLKSNCDLFTEHLFYYHNTWGSWMHSTQFSSPEKNDCLKKIQEAYTCASRDLMTANVLFITFGTNRHYRLKENGMVVANCHKFPSHLFSEEQIEAKEIAERAKITLSHLFEINNQIKVVFTVSPYRYKKYGLHGSQLSKAQLLLAVDEICRLFPANTYYFPAYEIVNDELRDYRFYADDMLHPSTSAVQYIWERFANIFLSDNAQNMVSDWAPIRNQLNHHFMSDDRSGQQAFLENLILSIEDFSKRYPSVNVDDELNLIKNKLNTR